MEGSRGARHARGPSFGSLCAPCHRGLDNRVYYMLAPEGQYYNYSGCGNTLNCNHPVVRKFIVDCLKYWVRAQLLAVEIATCAH